MCGYPCSGKSRRATELKEYFEQEHQLKVSLISDHSLGVDRNDVYDGNN